MQFVEFTVCEEKKKLIVNTKPHTIQYYMCFSSIERVNELAWLHLLLVSVKIQRHTLVFLRKKKRRASSLAVRGQHISGSDLNLVSANSK